MEQQSVIHPFSEHAQANLTSALIGARDLLNAIARSNSDEQVERIEKGLDLMFEAHLDQRRPGGSPYVNHTLLVAKVVVNKFGITDPDAVLASLLHDGPEDRAPKILALLGKKPAEDPAATIAAIAEYFGGKPDSIRKHLSGLTNPDFEGIAEQLRSGAENIEGVALFALYQRVTADRRSVRELTPKELKNALYLGHWVELSHGDQNTFAIKLADFFSNGLHRHLLLAEIAAMESGRQKEAMEAKAAKLGEKYGPVIDFLACLFTEAAASRRVIISERADRLLRSKIAFVKQHSK